jgi:hypothetical protein
MADFEHRDLSAPDETRTADKTKVELCFCSAMQTSG